VRAIKEWIQAKSSTFLLFSVSTLNFLKPLISPANIGVLPLGDQRTMKAHEQLWRVMQRIDQLAGGYLQLDEAVPLTVEILFFQKKR
jgi:hypothetical protein